MSADNSGVRIGIWVKARRNTLGLTLDQTAERMGLEWDPNWISQIENGRKKGIPSPEALNALGRALGVPVIDLLRVGGFDIPDDRPALPDGTAELHALIDAVDWDQNPEGREVVENIIRVYARLASRRS